VPAAICLPPARTAAVIGDAAHLCMKLAGRHDSHIAPHRIEVEFDATHLADAATVVPTVSLVTSAGSASAHHR
jgi:D-amino peptidase